MGKKTKSKDKKHLMEAAAAEQKKLYVFFWHGSHNSLHSLYALDLPNPSAPDNLGFTTITTTTTIRTSTGTETTTTNTVVRPEEPKRLHVDPLLQFPFHTWPSIMTCARSGSHLYFLGGQFGSYLSQKITYPNSVYMLDVRKPLPPLSFKTDPQEILTRMPPMNTGKINPISFAADKKIYVLSGQNHCHETGVKLDQFEIFIEEEQIWEKGEDPPFSYLLSLGPHVMVNRKVIIAATTREDEFKIYSYNLDGKRGKKWEDFDTSGWNKLDEYSPFYLAEGSQCVGKTIYTSYVGRHPSIPFIIPLRHFEKYSDYWDEKELLLDDDKFLDVIKYRIPSDCVSGYLALAGAERLCFVQAADFQPVEGSEGTAISVTLVQVSREDVSAKYLNSAHYLCEFGYFKVMAAYVVEHSA